MYKHALILLAEGDGNLVGIEQHDFFRKKYVCQRKKNRIPETCWTTNRGVSPYLRMNNTPNSKLPTASENERLLRDWPRSNKDSIDIPLSLRELASVCHRRIRSRPFFLKFGRSLQLSRGLPQPKEEAGCGRCLLKPFPTEIRQHF